MTRLSMRTMGNAIDAQHIGTRTLAANQLLKRRILEREAVATSDPALISVLAHQDKVIAWNQAAIQYGTARRQPKRSPNERRRKDFKNPEGFDLCGLNHGRSYSKPGRCPHGEEAGWISGCHASPDYHPSYASSIIRLSQAIDLCRPRMRACFASFTFGSQTEGKFQHTMKTAAELCRLLSTG